MKTMRAFIAITLPDGVRRRLGELSQALAALTPPRAVRWVSPDLLHLTVRFLGDTDVAKLPAIYAALDVLAAASPAFTLKLDQLGCFPNPRRPRVIWVGLQDEAGQAAALQQAVDQALIPLGWQPEGKPFQLHLTLGRVKDEAARLSDLPWGQPQASLPVPVTALHVIESQLRPTGPIYTIRHTSPLRS
ncbi:MAG: hypothetical protein Fur0021_26720 [Candidatus Promineifilaceae bacterium]